MTPARPIKGSTFAIVANGFAEGPAQALREFLLEQGAGRVTTILHPLVREGDTRHVITVDAPGTTPRLRRLSLPTRPPLTYPLDFFVPLRAPRADAWFGFNSLACARGLLARRLGRVEKAVYWCVDFVPDRFGSSPLTTAYDRLDRLCCRSANARFELSAAALEGRNARHRIPRDELAPALVVPMGAWVGRVPTTSPSAFEARKLVFLGHLVQRQGVGLVLEALQQMPDVTVEIIGRGPLEEDLRQEAIRRGVAKRVTFHGFVEDFTDVERILAEASVAIAPYEPDPQSFSRFADPGKLKSYLAAGLPIVMTDVPPNARELADRGAAELVPYSSCALADAARGLLDSAEEWRRFRESALNVARDFDWPRILMPALESIGLTSR